jgi:(1->4)-alpha-D-glucan 1-alpha-D-glucosylmutase
MSLRSSPALLAPEWSGLSECLDRLAAEKNRQRPLSTYRLQFHRGFRFADARRLVPYLHRLAITHCYASPILQARAGSTHGYDITDHNRINPEIGSEEDFYAMVAELKAHEMGLLLDIVPNHMGVSYGENIWWQDVLENGRASQYADFFDIDWQPVKTELRDKVLIPILGDSYGAELEQGRIQLRNGDGRLQVAYYEKTLPLDPATWSIVFETLGDLREQPPEIALSDAERSELENILWGLRELPRHTATEGNSIAQRQAGIPVWTQRFRELLQASPQAQALVEEAIRRCNGTPGEARSFDTLHRLLEAQAYRLAYWRVSADEINYRRFFDINDLAGLRMENPQVFAATHRTIRRLLAEGSVAGLRVDHPDGLLNPVQYFTRLQMLYAASQCIGGEPAGQLAENGIEAGVQELFGQHDWFNRQAPLYVLVEKILQPGEHLSAQWPVSGTVGYDFVRLVSGIFVDRRHERAFSLLYRRFVGGPVDVDRLVYESKKLIMRVALSGEVTVLSHMLEEISSTDRRARDYTRPALSEAIRETIACFPVYRTYIDERGEVDEQAAFHIQRAILRAKRLNPGSPAALFDWLRDILLLKPVEFGGPDEYRQRLRFNLKFQQLTGPVMAKGLEDTVGYVYNRFIAANDVGCSPAQFGIPVEEFHRGNQERSSQWPFSMLATSTHDTKRSEDVRARLHVLSEMPREWSAQAMRWRRLNRPRKKTISEGRTVPDCNEEYFLYQTLIGAWPLEWDEQGREDFTRRIQAYMNKVVHEAKVNLSWVNSDPEYAAALNAFVARILTPCYRRRPNVFRQEMEQFVYPIQYFGAMNSLAQTLIKITAPGVPDIYQGNEIWDFSLVDPDNRRPVDFEKRQRLAKELSVWLESGDVPWPPGNGNKSAEGLLPHLAAWLDSWRDGRLKLWTSMSALRFRREHAALFQFGSYLPLTAAGERWEHVVGYARVHAGATVLVAVPRLAYSLMKGKPAPPLGEVWETTELPLPVAGDEFVNVLTGERLSSTPTRTLLCREIFQRFPVALLAALG